MSYKIYQAYRIPSYRLKNFSLAFEECCLQFVIDNIKNSNGSKSKFKQEIIDIVEKSCLTEEEKNKIYLYLFKIFSAHISSIRNFKLGNLDCSFALYPDGTFSYIVPCIPYNCNLNFPEWVKDFKYYNNSDKPENISRKTWNYRRKKWDLLLKQNYEIEMNCLDFSSLFHKNTDHIIKELFGDNIVVWLVLNDIFETVKNHKD